MAMTEATINDEQLDGEERRSSPVTDELRRMVSEQHSGDMHSPGGGEGLRAKLNAVQDKQPGETPESIFGNASGTAVQAPELSAEERAAATQLETLRNEAAAAQAALERALLSQDSPDRIKHLQDAVGDFQRQLAEAEPASEGEPCAILGVSPDTPSGDTSEPRETVDPEQDTGEKLIDGAWEGSFTYNGIKIGWGDTIQYQENDGDIVEATVIGFVGLPGEKPQVALRVQGYNDLQFIVGKGKEFRIIAGPPEEPVEPGPPEDPVDPNPPIPPTPPGPPQPPAPPGTPPGPPESTPPEDPEEKLKNMVVGVADVHESKFQAAHQEAEEELMKDKVELDQKMQEFYDKHPGVANSAIGRGMLKMFYTARHPVETVWRQNIFRNATVQSRLYEFINGKRQDEIAFSDETAQATIERLGGGQLAREAGRDSEAGTLIHAGETVQGETDPAVAAMKTAVADLCKQFATDPSMTVDDFKEAKERIIASGDWDHKRRDGSGELVVDTVDNITVYAETLRQLFEHTQSMEKIDGALASMKFVTGEAKIGPRTESELPTTNRIIQKLQARGLGVVANEKTLAIAIATAGAIVTRGSSSVASRALRYGTLGAGAGIAGIGAYRREMRTTATERAVTARQRATSEQGPDAAIETTPHRERLTETLQDLVPADAIIGGLDAAILAYPEDGTGADQAVLQDMAAKLIEVRARLQWGDVNKQDTIRFSSEETMESERLAIDTKVIQIASMLESYYTAHPDQLPPAYTSFQEMIDSQSQLYKESQLEAMQEEGDEKFKSYARKRAVTKAALTVAGGVVGGWLVKEGLELADSKLGLGWLTETKTTPPRPLENTTHDVLGLKYDMPKEWRFDASPTGNGTSLVDVKGNVIADGLQTTPEGGLTQESIDLLEGKGMKIETTLSTVADVPETVHLDNNFIASQQPRISREWMNNNTSEFDLNELRAYWRVEGDQLVLDAGKMKLGGSFRGGRYVDALAEFRKGNGKMLFSLDKLHQSQPIALDVSPDGTLRLPINGPEAKSLFDLSGGDIKLKAAFWEVASGNGVTADGRTKFDVLATCIGEDRTSGVDVLVPRTKTLASTVITAMEPGTDAPWLFVPLPLSRFGLENIPPARRRGEEGAYIEGNGGGQFTPGSGAGRGVNPEGGVGVGQFEPGPDAGSGITPAEGGVGQFAPGNGVEIAPGAEDSDVLIGLPPTSSEPAIQPGGPRGEIGPGTGGGALERIPTNAGPEGRPELPGSPAIAEIPARAESLTRRISDRESAVATTADMMRFAGMNPEGQGFKDLGERVRKGLYTEGDLVAMKAMLELAGARIATRADQDSFDASREILATTEYFNQLERQFSAERLDQVTLLYDVVDSVRKFDELGFKMEQPQVAYGRLGNMIRRVQNGSQLKAEEYQWLTGVVQISAELTNAALRQTEERVKRVSKSPQERQHWQVEYAKRRERVRARRAAQENLLVRLTTLAGGGIATVEAAPTAAEVAPQAPVTQPEITAPDTSTPQDETTADTTPTPVQAESAPEVTTPEAPAAPLPTPPAGRRQVVDGQTLEFAPGPDGRIIATPVTASAPEIDQAA